MKLPRRATAPGTTRKPAARKRFSPQPANLLGTLSKAGAPAAPPSTTALSLRRNDSSTAFLSHWLTCQPPSAPRSATRALPLSSSSSAASTASRTSLLAGVTVSRASHAASIALSSSLDMGWRSSVYQRLSSVRRRAVCWNGRAPNPSLASGKAHCMKWRAVSSATSSAGAPGGPESGRLHSVLTVEARTDPR